MFVSWGPISLAICAFSVCEDGIVTEASLAVGNEVAAFDGAGGLAVAGLVALAALVGFGAVAGLAVAGLTVAGLVAVPALVGFAGGGGYIVGGGNG
jgi:hypothetical protein